jgi:hypothetical protein
MGYTDVRRHGDGSLSMDFWPPAGYRNWLKQNPTDPHGSGVPPTDTRFSEGDGSGERAVGRGAIGPKDGSDSPPAA